MNESKCMYICIHICIYICMYVCTCTPRVCIGYMMVVMMMMMMPASSCTRVACHGVEVCEWVGGRMVRWSDGGGMCLFVDSSNA
jgi:hypothetical protein